MRLSGEVCVVTGASSGIGRRTALDLARAGGRVCVAARRADRLSSVVEAMGGAGAGHSMVRCDVSVLGEVKALAEHLRAAYGRCDILVNNAGVTVDGGIHGPRAAQEVERVMATNFFGAVYCVAELIELLEVAAPSHVVNVASMAGRVALPGSAAYCASKFALVGWSESLHFELAHRGVFVSVVEPGLVPTEGFPQPGLVAHPLMRHALGSVEDVSEAIADAITRRKLERVVPRWYYLAQLPRVLAPPLYRWGLARLARRRGVR